jgi:predicted nucleic acid-binding protein
MTDSTPNPASPSSPGEGTPAAPDAAPAGSGGGDISANDGFTPEVQQLLARWLVEDGHATQEQVDAMLNADGIDPIVEDNRTEEAKAIDAAFPPAKPEDYRMPRFATDADSVQDIMRVEEASRAWLAEARFTREIGSFVAGEVARTAERFQRMDDTERQLWTQEQRVAVERLLGPDHERRLALGRQLIQEIEAKRPGLVRLLEDSGAGNNPSVVLNVVLQAERLAARLSKK